MTVKNNVDRVLLHSAKAGEVWRNTTPALRARFLEAIADEVEWLGMTLISTAMDETHLAEARLLGEGMRTY